MAGPIGCRWENQKVGGKYKTERRSLLVSLYSSTAYTTWAFSKQSLPGSSSRRCYANGAGCNRCYGLFPSCFNFCSALSRMSFFLASSGVESVASFSSAFFAYSSAKSFCPLARYASDKLS